MSAKSILQIACTLCYLSMIAALSYSWYLHTTLNALSRTNNSENSTQMTEYLNQYQQRLSNAIKLLGHEIEQFNQPTPNPTKQSLKLKIPELTLILNGLLDMAVNVGDLGFIALIGNSGNVIAYSDSDQKVAKADRSLKKIVKSDPSTMRIHALAESAISTLKNQPEVLGITQSDGALFALYGQRLSHPRNGFPTLYILGGISGPLIQQQLSAVFQSTPNFTLNQQPHQPLIAPVLIDINQLSELFSYPQHNGQTARTIAFSLTIVFSLISATVSALLLYQKLYRPLEYAKQLLQHNDSDSNRTAPHLKRSGNRDIDQITAAISGLFQSMDYTHKLAMKNWTLHDNKLHKSIKQPENVSNSTNLKDLNTLQTPSSLGSLEQSEIINRLAIAIVKKDFKFQYTAEWDSEVLKASGFSVNIHWRDSQLNDIDPLVFDALAEESGLVIPMLQMMLDQLCFNIKSWQRFHLNKLSFSIRLSEQQLFDPMLEDKINQLLKQYKLKPFALEFSIDTQLFSNQLERCQRISERLHKHGIAIAIHNYTVDTNLHQKTEALNISRIRLDSSYSVSEDLIQDKEVRLAISQSTQKALNWVVTEITTRDRLNTARLIETEELSLQGDYFGGTLQDEQIVLYLKKHSVDKRSILDPLQDRVLHEITNKP